MYRNTSIVPAVLALALGVSACATPATEDDAVENPYTIIQADASIPFGSSSVRGFTVGVDRSLLLDGPGGRWYRATLDPVCRGDLPWEQAIGFPEEPIDRVDRFSAVIVDGRRCAFRTFDEIADPRDVKAAAQK